MLNLNKMILSCRNNYLENIILLLVTFFLITTLLISAFYYDINVDASYYLGVTRLIMDGKVPFVDFKLHYSPLSFYLMCIPFALFGKTYTCAVISLYCIHLINSVLIYRILLQQKCSKKSAWFASILFLMFCILFEGLFYVLEPFVLLFGLLSIYSINKQTKNRLLIAGAFCCCSFLSKQYGLGYIFLLIFYITVSNNYSPQIFNKLLLLLVGFVVGLCIYCLFMYIQGINISQMISLSGEDYERNGLKGLIDAYWFVFKIFLPFPFTILISIFYLKKIVNDAFVVMSLLGFLIFMLPCYVRFYIHYLLLVLPFIIFFVFYFYHNFDKIIIKRILFLFLLFTFFISCYSVGAKVVNMYKNDYRKNKMHVSSVIAQYVPRGEKDVYSSFNLLSISLLNEYTPPLLTKEGMSNGFVTNSKKLMELLHNSRFSIISEEDFSKYYFNNIIKDYLRTNFDLKVIFCNDDMGKVYIYIKKN